MALLKSDFLEICPHQTLDDKNRVKTVSWKWNHNHPFIRRLFTPLNIENIVALKMYVLFDAGGIGILLAHSWWAKKGRPSQLHVHWLQRNPIYWIKLFKVITFCIIFGNVYIEVSHPATTRKPFLFMNGKDVCAEVHVAVVLRSHELTTVGNATFTLCPRRPRQSRFWPPWTKRGDRNTT